MFCQIHPVAHISSWNHFASSINHHKTTTMPSNINLKSQPRHHMKNAIFDSRLSNLHGLMPHTCLYIAGKCSLFTKRRQDFFVWFFSFIHFIHGKSLCFRYVTNNGFGNIYIYEWNVEISLYVCTYVYVCSSPSNLLEETCNVHQLANK